MFNVSVSLKGVKKTFFNKIIIQDVDESFYVGEVIGIIGENGIGKTTFIKLISGLIRPDKGEILIFNKNNQLFHQACMSHMGVVLENSRALYWRLSVWQNFIYFSGLKGIFGNEVLKNGEKILRIFNLWDLRNEKVETLSTGIKQRMAIVCAICHDPSIILFDEPTIGLDSETKLVLKNLISEFSVKSKTIIVTSHDHQFVESISHRILAIEKSGLKRVV